ETAMRRWLVCRSAGNADCVVTPSAAMLEDLQRYTRIPDARARVIPYGVPRERLAARAGRETAARDPGRPLRVLWVSHYADHKDLATLLRAVALLRERGETPVELWLTLEPAREAVQRGQHTPMPPDEQKILAGLAGCVRYLGVLRYEQTWQAYREADVFVFPSLCESFGHPLVEAMAAGLPVMASGIPVHREICGDAAEYFPPRNAEALASRLAAFAREGNLGAEMARRGAARVRNFLWEDHVERLLLLLRELAATRTVREPVTADAA